MAHHLIFPVPAQII